MAATLTGLAGDGALGTCPCAAGWSIWEFTEFTEFTGRTIEGMLGLGATCAHLTGEVLGDATNLTGLTAAGTKRPRRPEAESGGEAFKENSSGGKKSYSLFQCFLCTLLKVCQAFSLSSHQKLCFVSRDALLLIRFYPGLGLALVAHTGHTVRRSKHLRLSEHLTLVQMNVLGEVCNMRRIIDIHIARIHIYVYIYILHMFILYIYIYILVCVCVCVYNLQTERCERITVMQTTTILLSLPCLDQSKVLVARLAIDGTNCGLGALMSCGLGLT